MTKRQRAKLVRLRSVLADKVLVPEVLGVPRAAEALATIARVVDQLTATAAFQLSIALGISAGRAAARQKLARQLTLVARAARLLERTVKGQFDEVRVPRPRTEPRLLAAGALFIERSAPHARAFIDYGLPVTFLDDLQASIDGLRAAIGDGAGKRRMSAAAQVGVPAALSEAMAAVETLDLVVAIRYADDPAVLARWAKTRGRPQRSEATMLPFPVAGARVDEYLENHVAGGAE